MSVAATTVGCRDRQDVNDPPDEMVEDLLGREVGHHRASELAQDVGQPSCG